MGLYIYRLPFITSFLIHPKVPFISNCAKKLGSHPTDFAVNATEFGCIVPDFMLVIWIVIEPV